MLRFTLDTNCVIHRVQSQRWGPQVDGLVQCAREGKVCLYLSSAFDIDMERADPANALENLLWLARQPIVAGIPQPFMLDHSRLDDRRYVLVDDTVADIHARLQALIVPPVYHTGKLNPDDLLQMGRWRRKINDVQHLVSHVMAGNDAFVTTDQHDMLRKRDAIRAQCGIVVVGPAEALAMAQCA